MKQTKIAVVAKGCVACGNCARYCPKQAITINRGICAVVNASACIGCGRCAKACPAGVISVDLRDV